MRILYAGVPGGTCLHRANALRSLGHEVRQVVFGPPAGGLALQIYRLTRRLGRPRDFHRANSEIVRQLESSAYDMLWIDKGLPIRAATLERARRLRSQLVMVSYSPDDMFNPENSSVHYRQCLPLYDLHVTTKSYNVAELRERGARDALFIDNAYEPDAHRPIELSSDDRQRYGADVGFIGTFEADRAAQMLQLARDGIEVSVWGDGWRSFREFDRRLILRAEYLDGDEYPKAISATRINLAFLRKANRDLQTTRTIEIPACSGFMLAERTEEHLRLFDEGREAEFFGSYKELRDKCRHYLDHEELRARIAIAGRNRCLEGGYSNRDRLKHVLDYLAHR